MWLVHPGGDYRGHHRSSSHLPEYFHPVGGPVHVVVIGGDGDFYPGHWLTNAGILGRPLTRVAVRTFTKTTAIQHATENIRCNSIHPGPVDTPMLANISDNPEVLRQRTDEVPLGRLGVSRDIAYCALYLASHEATWNTGSELIIDGGITAK